MNEYKDEFKKSYQQGRAATRNDIEHLHETGELTHDLSYSMAKPVVYISLLVTIVAFFYGWLGYGFNFFLALLISMGAWFVSCILLALLMFGLVSIRRLGKTNH